MADDLYKAYDQKLAVNTPAAAANFERQYGGNQNVNATSRGVGSPSGTDWNQTFGNNNPASPSGTNWNTTFSQIGGQPNPQYSGLPSNAVNRGALAGNTTPPPSPGDLDDTFFGGPTPTPSPTPKPSLAFFRNRRSNSYSPLTARDFERYGAGADFGLT